MSKKLYWGIATLTILLIGVSVFFLMRNTDTEPTKVYKGDVKPSKEGRTSAKKLSETGKFTKWFEENKGTLVSDDSEQVKGRMPDKQEADNFPDWHSLTPEQQQHIYDQFYIQLGLKVPPRGYTYDWKERGVPYLDENGNPVLRRLDEPVIRIRMGIGFAPTKQEFERYNQLKEARWQAKRRDDVGEVARLDAEIEILKASAQGMRPLSVGAGWMNAEGASKSRRMAKEKFNAALREHGLEHLISPWD